VSGARGEQDLRESGEGQYSQLCDIRDCVHGMRKHVEYAAEDEFTVLAVKEITPVPASCYGSVDDIREQ